MQGRVPCSLASETGFLGPSTHEAEHPEGTALGLGVAASAVHVQSEKEAFTDCKLAPKGPKDLITMYLGSG